jgi:integration host factor subunit beta
MNRAVSKEFTPSMTGSELVKILSKKQRYLAPKDVAVAVKSLINILSNSLSSGEHIEIRGFGSFNLHYHQPRIGRNPRTGESVNISGKYVPHFKPANRVTEKSSVASGVKPR